MSDKSRVRIEIISVLNLLMFYSLYLIVPNYLTDPVEQYICKYLCNIFVVTSLQNISVSNQIVSSQMGFKFVEYFDLSIATHRTSCVNMGTRRNTLI